MNKLIKELRGYSKEAILAPLFKFIEAALELTVPLIVADIIDTGINGGGGTRYILIRAAVLLLLGVLGLGFSVTAQYFAAKAAVGVAADLRSRLFKKIQSLTFSALDKSGTSTLLTRMTSDINQVQTGINMALRLLLRAPVVVFGAMLAAFMLDVDTAVSFAVAIPVLLAVIFFIMYITVPMYRRVQQRLDKVLGLTRENLSGVRVVRAFCHEEREVEEYDAANSELKSYQLKVGRISAVMSPATYVIINLAIVWLVHTGALRVYSGAISQGTLIALYNYMLQILTELIKLANLIITITKSLASSKRVYSVFDIDGETEELSSNTAMPLSDTNAPAIEFKNVSLNYTGTGEPSLEGISFTIDRGESFGIIGGTGSGKSSVIGLIPRFYDATEGTVLVNGSDVKSYPLKGLRSLSAVVMQKAVLFKGTIRENLLWGNPEATEEQLLEAVAAAQAEDVVRSKNGGLDAAVEQNGKNFSGGQRQRLTVARALVRKPEILILDDSSSALDFATEAALRSAISSLPYRPTVITVSQRASAVMHADRILVMSDGRAVGLGSHSELMSSCELYREIYASQFEGEECAK